MRELAATGWMSNRGRQNVASFLTKDLGIDWRWGGCGGAGVHAYCQQGVRCVCFAAPLALGASGYLRSCKTLAWDAQQTT